MKIGYLIKNIDEVGGREKIVLTKARELASLGFDVTIISYYTYGKNKENLSNVKFFSFDLNDSGKFNPVKYFIRKSTFKRKLYDLLVMEKLDIVITMVEEFIYDTQNICKKLGVKSILELHGSYDYYRGIIKTGIVKDVLKKTIRVYEYSKLKLIMRHFDVVVILSQHDSSKWNLENSVVIPNFLPDGEFFRTRIDKGGDKSKFVAAGRLTKEKGFDILVDVWNELKSRNKKYSLTIYGDGPQLIKLQEKINNLGLDELITIHPFVDNFVETIIEFDCLLVTSRYEAFPMVVLEGISNGLPIIAFDLECGIRDMVESDYNGYLIPRFNVQTMADLIIKTDEDDELRCKFGENSLTKSIKFRREVVLTSWLNLFELMRVHR